jgi:hypothetical protein
MPGTNKAHLVRTALIYASKHASSLIFGRCLLERLMLACGRAGIERFFVEKGECSVSFRQRCMKSVCRSC